MSNSDDGSADRFMLVEQGIYIVPSPYLYIVYTLQSWLKKKIENLAVAKPSMLNKVVFEVATLLSNPVTFFRQEILRQNVISLLQNILLMRYSFIFALMLLTKILEYEYIFNLK